MSKTGKNEFILKKSYEIAYALWRVAANISEPSLAAKLSQKAIDLIGYAADDEIGKMEEKLPGLEFLLKFGADVNAISSPNEEILMEEIGNLKSAILEMDFGDGEGTRSKERLAGNLMKEKNMDVFDIFLKENNLVEIGFDALPENEPETMVENLDELQNTNGAGKAELRQSAILERIRQIGNCRLSDIQAILPDASERTIRYDLETLVQKKLIDRIGTGGRGVYYKLSGNGSR